MSARTIVGVILILAGAAGLLGLLKTSKQDNVVDLGGIRVSTEQKSAVPPWIGGALAVAGLAVLLSGSSRKP